MTPSRAADDRGSAVVEFVLVGLLVIVLAMGVVQLALTLHVRNTLLSCASEGAHVGARADRTPADGADRAAELAHAALGSRPIDVDAQVTSAGGPTLVQVTMTTSVPLVGLWGAGTMSVRAHAIAEDQDG